MHMVQEEVVVVVAQWHVVVVAVAEPMLVA